MKVVQFWISPLLIHASTFLSDDEVDETNDSMPATTTEGLTSILRPDEGHVITISGLRGAHPTHDMSEIDLSSPPGDFDEWEELPDPRGSPETIKLLTELDIEFVQDWEGLDLEGRRRSNSLIPKVKETVDVAVSVAAAGAKEHVKPVADQLGRNVLTGVTVVGNVLHDTGLDTLDTIQNIPWAQLTHSALEGGQKVAVTLGSATLTAAGAFAATPLGQRLIGGVDMGISYMQLKATEGTNYVVKSAYNRLGDYVSSLEDRERRLNDRLNSHGLPRGEVVAMDSHEEEFEDVEWPEEVAMTSTEGLDGE